MKTIVAFLTESDTFAGIVGMHGDSVSDDIIPIAIEGKEATEGGPEVDDMMNDEIFVDFA
jgi:hypothetical protein